MSKALTKEEISLNAHVEELRERMRMLQSDRTANVDVLEANKAANKVANKVVLPLPLPVLLPQVLPLPVPLPQLATSLADAAG